MAQRHDNDSGGKEVIESREARKILRDDPEIKRAEALLMAYESLGGMRPDYSDYQRGYEDGEKDAREEAEAEYGWRDVEEYTPYYGVDVLVKTETCKYDIARYSADKQWYAGAIPIKVKWWKPLEK